MAGYASPTATHTPTTGQVIPAAWGTAVDVGMDYQATNKAHCRVFNNANISLATSGTAQALTFNSERYDVGACHSTSSNTSRLTVPTGEGGVYEIFGNVQFGSNATGHRSLSIRVNGTTTIAYHRSPNLAGFAENVILHISTHYALAAADYVELLAEQTSGGALNAEVVANYSPEFGFMWMST